MAGRLVKLQAIVLGFFFLLILRLAHLQLFRGGYYRELAEKNRLRVLSIPAPRGLIVDRNGIVLASNTTQFRVAIIPQELVDLPLVLARVSSLVKRPAESLRREYQKNKTLAFVPVTIVPHVSKEVALKLEQEAWGYPGLLIQAEPARHYPAGPVAAQLLGYLSQPTADELPQLKQYGVRPKQLVGRIGLEQLLEDRLRGQAGGTVVEINHRGRQMQLVGFREPRQGEQARLTLDFGLQALIEQTFAGQPGAAVALNPETGAVLAMVSSPVFFPEAFAVQNSAAIKDYLSDSATPLLNRATAGNFQPGSILKPLTAVAGLSSHLIEPRTVVNCPGHMDIGDRTIHCWNRDGHGPLDVTGGLMNSCNVFFMHTGRAVRKERLLAVFREAGLGSKTGWMSSELSGHLPSRRLSEGELAMLAIGQGEILITPLQAAVMAAVFANRGHLVQPWVIDQVGEQPWKRPAALKQVAWPAEMIEIVRRAMIETVRHPTGTAHRAFTPTVTIAGKTGTAQTHQSGRNHGWFIGFCPADKPTMALAVVSEFGGSGGDLPTEIARTACEYMAVTEAAGMPDDP